MPELLTFEEASKTRPKKTISFDEAANLGNNTSVSLDTLERESKRAERTFDLASSNNIPIDVSDALVKKVEAINWVLNRTPEFLEDAESYFRRIERETPLNERIGFNEYPEEWKKEANIIRENYRRETTRRQQDKVTSAIFDSLHGKRETWEQVAATIPPPRKNTVPPWLVSYHPVQDGDPTRSELVRAFRTNDEAKRRMFEIQNVINQKGINKPGEIAAVARNALLAEKGFLKVVEGSIRGMGKFTEYTPPHDNVPPMVDSMFFVPPQGAEYKKFGMTFTVPEVTETGIYKNPFIAAADKIDKWIKDNPESKIEPNNILEHLMQMTSSTVGYAALSATTFGVGPFFSGYNEAHEAAIEAGMGNDAAKALAMPVGIAYALVERLQVKGLFSKGAATGLKKAALGHIIKQATLNLAKRASKEGIEEGTQFLLTQIGPMVMGKAKWGELVQELGFEVAAGALMGFVFDAGGVRSFLDANAEVISQEDMVKVLSAFKDTGDLTKASLSAIATPETELETRAELAKRTTDELVEKFGIDPAFAASLVAETQDAALAPEAEPVIEPVVEPVVEPTPTTEAGGKQPWEMTVQRIDEPGVVGGVEKPQGLYTSPADLESPHAELGGKTRTFQTNPNANVLDLGEAGQFKTNRGDVPSSAGVAAARRLIGDSEVSRMSESRRSELRKELSSKYPDVDWSKYSDQQEMIEAVAGIEAKKAGYDAIFATDAADPKFTEYVALTDNAFATPTTEAKPVTKSKVAPTGALESVSFEKPIKTVSKPGAEPISGPVVDTETVSGTPEGGVQDRGALEWHTSARKAAMSEDREALGLDAIPSPDRKGWQTSLDNARKAELPVKALRLASEVNTTPRALNDEETAGMVIKATQLKTEYSSLMNEMQSIVDESELKTKAAEIERIEHEFDSLSTALNASGTEKGRALASQKITIDRNYDLISVKTRAKAAKGKALTDSESKALQEQTVKLDEANAKIETLQEQLKIASVTKALTSRPRGLARKPMTKANRTAKINRIRELLEAGC